MHLTTVHGGRGGQYNRPTFALPVILLVYPNLESFSSRIVHQAREISDNENKDRDSQSGWIYACILVTTWAITRRKKLLSLLLTPEFLKLSLLKLVEMSGGSLMPRLLGQSLPLRLVESAS